MLKRNMKNYSFTLFYFVAIIVCFFNCKNKTDEKTTTSITKFSKNGRFLIKETYDSVGKVATKQYFNSDTVHDGACIEYFNNGNIGSWKWYIPRQKDPICGVFYYEDGSFDTFKGRPYLTSVRSWSQWFSVRCIDYYKMQEFSANIVVTKPQ